MAARPVIYRSINETQITGMTGATWNAITGTSFGIPVEATAVVLKYVTTVAAQDCGARPTGGSTDGITTNPWMWEVDAGADLDHYAMRMVSCHGNGWDVYVESTANTTVYTVGYFVGEGIQLFNVPIDLGTLSSGAWTDMDVTNYVSADASAAIIISKSGSTTNSYIDYRPNGNTTYSANTSAILEDYQTSLHILPLDANKIFEYYAGSATVIDPYIAGYIEGGTWYTDFDSRDKSSSYAAWQTVDMSTELPSGGAAIFHTVIDGASSLEYGVRKTGETDDRRGHMDLGGDNNGFTQVIALDSGDDIDLYAESSSVHHYLIGVLPFQFPTIINHTLVPASNVLINQNWDGFASPVDPSYQQLRVEHDDNSGYTSPTLKETIDPILVGADSEAYTVVANELLYVRYRVEDDDYGNQAWQDGFFAYAKAVLQVTSGNAPTDGGTPITDGWFIAIYQGDFDSLAQTAAGHRISTTIYVNKGTTWPANLHVPGGPGSYKYALAWAKPGSGKSSISQPDIDPTTTA